MTSEGLEGGLKVSLQTPARSNFAGVDGGQSKVPRMCRHGSKEPHRRQRNFTKISTNLVLVVRKHQLVEASVSFWKKRNFLLKYLNKIHFKRVVRKS